MIRYFGSGELNGSTADLAQNPCGAPDRVPLWTVLQLPPGGGRQWYLKLAC